MSKALDSVLRELGDFGPYQIRTICLLCIAITLGGMMEYAFVFKAKNPGYRCRIPQCNDSSTNFYPTWLPEAVPNINGKPESCQQFQSITDNTQLCDARSFNNITTSCQNGYVYYTDQQTIVNDFDIHCDTDTWKLTLVGTINYFGFFVGSTLAGSLSDRYGRRIVMTCGCGITAIIGIIQTFSINYVMFVALEFVSALFSAGIFTCSYIIGIELVSPSRRIVCSAILASFMAIGGICDALLAWCITSWRNLCLVIYTPGILVCAYPWLISDSVRWLLSQGHKEKANDILSHVAKVNKKTVSQETLNDFLNFQDPPNESFLKLIKSPILRLRLINCGFSWITVTLVYYGITLNSVSLAEGNGYINFMLINLVEIPCNVMASIMMQKFGRRYLHIISFLLTGITCIIGIYATNDTYYLQLFVTLFGKCGATISMGACHIHTSEMFPTPMRHSVIGVCCMLGRIGSLISPQMPLMAQVWPPLPMVSFGTMSIIAGCLSFLFPETRDTKLPDTIEEAENIVK